MQVIQSFKDYFLRNSIDLVGLLSICIIYAIVIFINFRKSSQISMPKYLRSIKDIKDDDEFEYIEQVIKNFEQRDVNQLEFLKMKNESAIEGYKLVGMLTTFIALMVALLTYFIKTLCLSRAHLVFENQSILECFYGISILAIMLYIFPFFRGFYERYEKLVLIQKLLERTIERKKKLVQTINSTRELRLKQ